MNRLFCLAILLLHGLVAVGDEPSKAMLAWSEYDHFPDPEHGEWFGYLDRTGRVTSTWKGNLWKGPFHLPRMQIMCSRILSMS